MAQVLVNLLVNAAQAMPTRGTVTLRTWQEAGHAHLSVQDTGMGMSPQVQARLFEPFFTTKPVGEGTGMGLAVVHGVVSAHGGSVEVQSAVGQGTTFTLRLPCERPAPVALAPEQLRALDHVAPGVVTAPRR
jgi:signal transduction histidine kinase